MITKTKPVGEACQRDTFCGVNIVQDPEERMYLEKRYLPVISAPKRVKKGESFEVTVEVGKLLEHPNEPGHFIEFIELYAGDTYLARMDFTAKTTGPIMKARVSLDPPHGRLRAFERCNLHGTWLNEVDIEVAEEGIRSDAGIHESI
jgi:superoxide reductase